MARVFHAGLSHSYPIPMWIDDDVFSLVLRQGFVCKTKFVVCSEEVIGFTHGALWDVEWFGPHATILISICNFAHFLLLYQLGNFPEIYLLSACGSGSAVWLGAFGLPCCRKKWDRKMYVVLVSTSISTTAYRTSSSLLLPYGLVAPALYYTGLWVMFLFIYFFTRPLMPG